MTLFAAVLGVPGRVPVLQGALQPAASLERTGERMRGGYQPAHLRQVRKRAPRGLWVLDSGRTLHLLRASGS